jgi:hypothetical protein
MIRHKWKSAQGRLHQRSASKENRAEGVRLEIELASASWEELERAIEAAPREEIQIDWEESWTLFLKPASQGISENRLLVAHPEEGRWVATCVLSLDSWERLQQNLRNGEVEFHRLGGLHFLSNLEMVWKKD